MGFLFTGKWLVVLYGKLFHYMLYLKLRAFLNTRSTVKICLRTAYNNAYTLRAAFCISRAWLPGKRHGRCI